MANTIEFYPVLHQATSAASSSAAGEFLKQNETILTLSAMLGVRSEGWFQLGDGRVSMSTTTGFCAHNSFHGTIHRGETSTRASFPLTWFSDILSVFFSLTSQVLPYTENIRLITNGQGTHKKLTGKKIFNRLTLPWKFFSLLFSVNERVNVSDSAEMKKWRILFLLNSSAARVSSSSFYLVGSIGQLFTADDGEVAVLVRFARSVVEVAVDCAEQTFLFMHHVNLFKIHNKVSILDNVHRSCFKIQAAPNKRSCAVWKLNDAAQLNEYCFWHQQ